MSRPGEQTLLQQLSQVLQNSCCWHTPAQHGHRSSQRQYIPTPFHCLQGKRYRKWRTKKLQQLWLLQRSVVPVLRHRLRQLWSFWSRCVTMKDNRQKKDKSNYPDGHCPCLCRNEWRFCVTIWPETENLATFPQRFSTFPGSLFWICRSFRWNVLFWKTRSYQGRRRLVGGLRGSSSERRVIFNSCAVQLFNSHNKKVLDIAPFIFLSTFPLI